MWAPKKASRGFASTASGTGVPLKGTIFAVVNWACHTWEMGAIWSLDVVRHPVHLTLPKKIPLFIDIFINHHQSSYAAPEISCDCDVHFFLTLPNREKARPIPPRYSNAVVPARRPNLHQRSPHWPHMAPRFSHPSDINSGSILTHGSLPFWL